MLEHGIDLLEIKRIHEAVENHGERFIARILSPEEQAYFSSKFHGASEARKNEWLAGRYAAKEAILKALGTGLAENISWHDITVLPNDLGAPVVRLQKTAQERYTALGAKAIRLSISHDGGFVIASCLIETAEN